MSVNLIGVLWGDLSDINFPEFYYDIKWILIGHTLVEEIRHFAQRYLYSMFDEVVKVVFTDRL